MDNKRGPCRDNKGTNIAERYEKEGVVRSCQQPCTEKYIKKFRATAVHQKRKIKTHAL